MNEEFRIIAQSYCGMTPKDKGCKTWGEMQQKMADELERVVKNCSIPDVSGSLFDFVKECERMISLYKNQRYTQAEQLRDKLSERLDDVMRDYCQ